MTIEPIIHGQNWWRLIDGEGRLFAEIKCPKETAAALIAMSEDAKRLDEVLAEQRHGRSKYGRGPDDFEHDDNTAEDVWHRCISDHNERGKNATPMERRQHLIKVAGLALSAVQAFDRKRNRK